MVKQILLFLLAGIVCLVVGLVLFDRVIMPRVVKYGQEVEVPDVTEKSLEEATNILQTRGLILSVERWQQTEQLLAGQIIFQRPDPFSQVKVGRHIYVVVSKGGKLYEVPDVCGLSEREARLLLEQGGLKVGPISREASDQFQKGTIISQVPAPDTTVGADVLVNLVVSIGPEEGGMLMPNLVGKALKEALTVLEKMNLKPGTISYLPNVEYLPDTVLEQSVQPGEEVQRGEQVDLVVSEL